MRGRLTFTLAALVALVAALVAALPGLAVAALPSGPEQAPAPSAQPAPDGPTAAEPVAPDRTDRPPPPDAPLPPPHAARGPDDTPGEPPASPGGEAELALDTALHDDDELGPLIQIERIDITGNTSTQVELIQRALPIAAGDVLHSSDRRLREARFKVLALGFFRDVNLRIHKGSQRGQVIIEVNVIERGTLILNRLWFGTSDLSPWWLGADLGDRNLLGLGIAVGGGFIYSRHGDLAGARNQYAAELRAAVPSVHGSRWGTSWAATLVHGSEPYRTRCDPVAADPRPQCAFDYRRLGARIGGTYDLSALTTLSIGVRVEAVDGLLPAAPVQTLADGTAVAVDLHLDPNTSRVVTASLGFDRDTRPDPILPHAGSLAVISAELGSTLLGGSYDYATIFGRYDQYWQGFGEHHAIAVKLAGGVVVGDAPRFDRIHIADVDHMLTPRALGLVLSTAGPLAILGTRPDKPTYGDLGGSATLEYTFQLFRGSGKQRVYGGDVFLGAGLWGLAERADLRARDTALVDSLPVDMYLDAGLRIDTDIGVFELTIANALGRLR